MTSIYFLGEAWGEQEEREKRAFAGPSGGVLRSLLRQAGIDTRDCTFDSVFNFRPAQNRIESLTTTRKADALPGYPAIKPGHYIAAEHGTHLQRLQARIERAKPNIIVALGNTPLWAICRRVGIKKFRGAPLLTFDGQYKVLPTWHPAAILRQWNLRPIAFMDIAKAADEANDPRLVRPRRHIHIEPTLEGIAAFYEQYIAPAKQLGCDIETKAGTITEIGFAPSTDRCLLIPFWSRTQPDGNYWRTPEQEREAWAWVRRICAEKPLIGQNFQYDMQYLSRTVGIPCPHFAGDTMLLHHTLQPELEKGLGFLGSVYTREPSWKFMRADHSTMKREDD